MVANLIPYKDHVDLLHGLALAVAQGAALVRLILVGDDAFGHVEAVRSVAREHRLEDRVVFAGRRSDVSRLLADAVVGVLASHHEGFSNALLEYMAAALPVVATATGGNLDAVDDGRTGVLVPVGRPDEIARALFQLVRDRNLRVRIGEAGRTKLKAEFRLEAGVTRYEEAYRGVLSGTSRPRS